MKTGLIIFSILLVGTFAFAQEQLNPASGWYVRIDAGFSSASDPDLRIPSGPLPADLGNSAVIGGGLGYSLVSGLRGDVTLTYGSGFEQISGFAGMPEGRADLDSFVTLVSLYLDLITTARVSPYGGFGIGFAQNKLGTITITNPDGSLLGTIEGKSKTHFAWQLCAGAAIQMTERWLLDVGYHLLRAGDYESEDSVLGKTVGQFHANEIIVSAQYTF
jgi:opacity protein-like surface antigen